MQCQRNHDKANHDPNQIAHPDAQNRWNPLIKGKETNHRRYRWSIQSNQQKFLQRLVHEIGIKPYPQKYWDKVQQIFAKQAISGYHKDRWYCPAGHRHTVMIADKNRDKCHHATVKKCGTHRSQRDIIRHQMTFRKEDQLHFSKQLPRFHQHHSSRKQK